MIINTCSAENPTTCTVWQLKQMSVCYTVDLQPLRYCMAFFFFLNFLQTFGKGRLVAMYAPNEPVLDYNMVIIFLMAVGTVAVGGYWAGSRDSKKQVDMMDGFNCMASKKSSVTHQYLI